MYRAVADQWNRNRSMALRAAESASGLTREQIQDWAEREPRAIPLYLKVLWAAGMNGHDQTLAAMGAVLGRAARATATGDDSGFETAELALRAMAELSPSHFRVLAVIAAAGPVVSEDGSTSFGACMPEAVAEAAGLNTETTNQCLLNLAAAGLAVSRSVYGGTAYPVSELGLAVLRAAVAARETKEPAPE
jgi:hypothetical protein